MPGPKEGVSEKVTVGKASAKFWALVPGVNIVAVLLTNSGSLRTGVFVRFRQKYVSILPPSLYVYMQQANLWF